MPQLLAFLALLLAALLVAGFILALIFWPFTMTQQYFLIAQGIDKYTAVPLTVGIIAQLAYWGVIVGLLACLVSEPMSPAQDGTMKLDRGRYWKRVALSGGLLVAVVAAIFWMVWPPERSGAEHYRMFEEKCQEEIGSDTKEAHSLLDDCVERKIDAL
ncbi:hypothetical protein L612_005200000060 [Rhodococcus rhodochrous J38]|nr:hypothetical protein L612_005200000060 [Rhodococcus rhodochrous J38]